MPAGMNSMCHFTFNLADLSPYLASAASQSGCSEEAYHGPRPPHCACGASAGAAAAKKPLYEHIADLAGNPTSSMYLPVPAFNIINGGSHAGNKLAMQEFMILPVGASSFTEAMKMVRRRDHRARGGAPGA